MGTILNVIMAFSIVFLIITWIVSLVMWDGKCHCDPKDCDNCPYGGTGCDIDPKTKNNQGV